MREDTKVAQHYERRRESVEEASLISRSDWASLYRRQDTAADYDRRYRGWSGRSNNRWIWRAVRRQLERLEVASDAPLIDVPAGTGRFTAQLRARGHRLIHLDLSPQMLARLRAQHGCGREVVGDLRRPPLRHQPEAVLLCLRLMQHLNREERIEALRGLRTLAPTAIVAYYPGWHLKSFGRRLRHAVGFPHNSLREWIRAEEIRAEVQTAGWQLARMRAVLPLFSENVLLSLTSART